MSLSRRSECTRARARTSTSQPEGLNVAWYIIALSLSRSKVQLQRKRGRISNWIPKISIPRRLRGFCPGERQRKFHDTVRCVFTSPVTLLPIIKRDIRTPLKLPLEINSHKPPTVRGTSTPFDSPRLRSRGHRHVGTIISVAIAEISVTGKMRRPPLETPGRLLRQPDGGSSRRWRRRRRRGVSVASAPRSSVVAREIMNERERARPTRCVALSCFNTAMAMRTSSRSFRRDSDERHSCKSNSWDETARK